MHNHTTPSFRKHCFRRPVDLTVIALTTLLLTSAPAFSEPTVAFNPLEMRVCPQADGSALYTNKDLPGCTLMTLKPLSIVPSLEDMPTYRPSIPIAPHHDIPPYQDRQHSGIAGDGQTVPDWAKDWHASIASSGSVQAEICSLYGEWLHLNQKTRGGFFYGADPSYGGELSGRNQQGPSYSFYDNARYMALSKMFGQGFIPLGCR